MELWLLIVVLLYLIGVILSQALSHSLARSCAWPFYLTVEIVKFVKEASKQPPVP